MKSLLVRWGLTLGLVGSTLFSSVTAFNLPVLALTEQQVKEKLDSVPVYLITNDQGLPLSRTLPAKNGQQSASVTGVYMSRQEAEKFIQDLRKAKNKNPKLEEMARKLQVTAVPLGVIYQQLQQTKNQQNRLLFAFKPVDQEIQGALTLLKASGQKIDQEKFKSSVPVFAVRFSPDKGYVPIQMGEKKEQMIPLFLSKKDAQSLLSKVKPKFPTADIQVIDVNGVIQTLKDKNDSWLTQVVLVPSAESREYIRTLPKK
ncbi:Tic22 family protein [Okeanomitos corallinicola TIOX110]|uniref:Tic22 family protein n=1 Tax=Okeanomitos corallinicola TIOX110 TaxID=3133117 RepID=A0ABZ2UNE0_9CYAN